MTIEEALEFCLTMLASGEMTLEECLAQFPQYAAELRPMLEMAALLSAIEMPPLSPVQIEAMQTRIMEQAIVTPVRPVMNPWPFIMAALVAAVMIVIGAIFFLRDDAQRPLLTTLEVSDAPTLATSTPEPAITVTPAISPTATIPASATATSEATGTLSVSEPTSMATFAPVATTLSDEAMLPVQIEISGSVEHIDEEAGTITVDGVPVQLDMTLLPPEVASGTPLTVSGLLMNDGTIVSDAVVLNPLLQTPETPDNPAVCQERCHPVLLILAESYDVPYETLENLHRQDKSGVGEIARMLAIAQASGADLTEIIAQRESGLTWGEIMQTYPEIAPADLAPGIIIREGNRPENAGGENGQPGSNNNPGNATGNANGQPGNNNNPGGGNGNANGNANGQGNGNANGNANGNSNGNANGRGGN